MPLNPKSLQRQFVVVSENPPSSPFEGQIWVNEIDGKASQYFNGEWQGIGISKQEAEEIAITEGRKQAIIF